MVRVRFTPQLRRFTETPAVDCTAPTLAAALQSAFARNPRLQGYVLDDQGHVRPNVAIFIDGRRIADGSTLSDPIGPDSEVWVMQALSGG